MLNFGAVCMDDFNSIQPSPSWKANSSSDIQEIFRILWIPWVNYRLQKKRVNFSYPEPDQAKP